MVDLWPFKFVSLQSMADCWAIFLQISESHGYLFASCVADFVHANCEL